MRSAATEQLRIVAVHQPVAVPRASEGHNVLRGAAAAMRAWAAAGAALVLGGHTRRYVLALHERLPELPRRISAVQAGTAVSARIGHEADNSVNLVRYRPNAHSRLRATVERWDHREESGRFDLERADELELDR